MSQRGPIGSIRQLGGPSEKDSTERTSYWTPATDRCFTDQRATDKRIDFFVFLFLIFASFYALAPCLFFHHWAQGKSFIWNEISFDLDFFNT